MVLLIRAEGDLFTVAIRWHPCSDRPPSLISSDVTDPSHSQGRMMACTGRVPQRSPFISSQEGGVPMLLKRVFHGVSRGVIPHCAQVIHSPARLREPHGSLFALLRRTFVQAAAGRTMEQLGRRNIGVARSADSAEHTVPGDGVGAAMEEHFVSDPKDENRGKKNRQIDENEPGEGDRYHRGGGPPREGPQRRRTRPQVIRSACWNRRDRIQTRPASSLEGSPDDSKSTQCRGIPSGPTETW